MCYNVFVFAVFLVSMHGDQCKSKQYNGGLLPDIILLTEMGRSFVTTGRMVMTRDGTGEPVSRDQILNSQARTRTEIFIFSVQLTTCRTGKCDHAYIHILD